MKNRGNYLIKQTIIILLICTTFFCGCVMNVKYVKDDIWPCQHSISYDEDSGFWESSNSNIEAADTAANDKRLQEALSTYPESKKYLDECIASISQRNTDSMIMSIDWIILVISLLGMGSSLGPKGTQEIVYISTTTASISTCIAFYYSWKIPFDIDGINRNLAKAIDEFNAHCAKK
jgi:hypothetical protein